MPLRHRVLFLLVLFTAIPAHAELEDPWAEPFAQIAKAREDRDYQQVISLLEVWRKDHPDDRESLLQLAQAHLTTQDYEKVYAQLDDYLKTHADCYSCYPLIWQALVEEKNGAPEALEQIRSDLAVLERQTPPSRKREKSAYLLALFQGYENLEEKDRLEQVAERIRREADKTPALSYLADWQYIDVLRTWGKDEKAERFVQRYPTHPQAELIYSIALTRKAAEARKDPKKIAAVKKWVKTWIRKRPKSRKAYYASAVAFQNLGIKKWQTSCYLKKALRLLDRYGGLDREPYDTDLTWRQRLQEERDQILQASAWQDFLRGKEKRSLARLRSLEKSLKNDGRYLFHRATVAKSLDYRMEAKEFFEQSLVHRVEIEKSLEQLQELRGDTKLHIADLMKEKRRQLKAPYFVEVTKEVGLAEVRGSWIAWGDYDGDGREDLLTGNGLFKNEQDSEGKVYFRNVWGEVTDQSIERFGSGVWGDLDRDGDLDLFLAKGFNRKRGEAYDRILINEVSKRGKFVDRTKAYIGIRSPSAASAAAWGDFDRDGFLDLYVANFEKPGKKIGIGNADFLYHNLKGKCFVEISKQAGCISLEPMCGRGVTWGDFDNDGYDDLYVSNYRLDPNFLFYNNGDGTFRNIAKQWNARGENVAGNYGHTIGSEFGDWDNDGDLDLITANLAHPRALAYSNKTQVLRNDLSENHFTDSFFTSGIEYQETHSDPSLGDLDNDGNLDLILTAIYPHSYLRVYQGAGDGSFTNVTFAAGIDVANSWGSALADFDGDGDLDLAVASTDGVRLFQNAGMQGGHYLQVKPVDRKSGSVAIGARITILSSHGKKQIREIQGGKGTGNQHSFIASFGFGQDANAVDVLVRFPDGRTVRKKNVSLNQMLKIYSP